MIKLFILFIALASSSFAQSARIDDPHYVDLVPSKFTDSPNCRSSFDQSNPLKCQNRVEQCDYDVELFTKVTPFQVKGTNPREQLFAQVDGFARLII